MIEMVFMIHSSSESVRETDDGVTPHAVDWFSSRKTTRRQPDSEVLKLP